MSETPTAAEVAAPHRYTAALAADIEARWQDFWDANGTYAAPNPSGELAGDEAVVARPKKFIMDMFPYPSGAGLHVGHPLGYIATDVYARYHRMTGHNVLHTLGFDAFGLPAEQYAVQTGTHPRVSTEANIENMKAQLRRLGLGHDKRRSFATIEPEYYKWTQWIFLQIFNSWYDPEAKKARPIAELVAEFEGGRREIPGGRAWSELNAVERDELLGGYRLAYASDAPVNWCPGLGTVLANEEVTADGRSERGNFPVFKSKLRQWNMRITAYADRLIDDLDALDWPEAIKLQQRNWIGRSEGARVDFQVDGHEARKITVFTTRPDTLFGATYMVLAPEHDLIDTIVPAEWPEGTKDVWTAGAGTPAEAVAAYRKQAQSKTDVERQTEGKDKTGVFTGAYALNPVTGERVPVFVADYVLMGYGTGAIMAVPGQDERDWEFATVFELPIVRTVQPPEGWEGEAYNGQGPAINSANAELDLNGMQIDEAKRTVIAHLEARASARAPSTSACATGSSAASATGASPSRSSTTRTASPTRCPSRCSRWSCPRSTTTPRAPSTRTTRTPPRRPRSPATRTGSTSSWTWATGRRRTAARPTPCPTGPVPAGTSCATWTRATTSSWSPPTPSATGWARARASRWAASTCTSAVPSTPCSTCCTPASGRRSSSTWATSPRPSRSTSSTTRA